MTNVRMILGEYLISQEPVAAVWSDLVDIVYYGNPRQAVPDRLGAAARTLWHVGCFEGEVINGGISQFFSNSSGNFAHESLTALRQIGADLCVNILEKALTLFPDSSAPQERKKRCELLFAFEEHNSTFLDDLTEVLYERVVTVRSLPEEDLVALRLEFIQANKWERVRA